MRGSGGGEDVEVMVGGARGEGAEEEGELGEGEGMRGCAVGIGCLVTAECGERGERD